MIVTTARVLDRTRNSSLILLEPVNCGGCLKRCGARKSLTAILQGNYASSVEISLTFHNQMILLINSLLLPLLGFVLGGFVGQWIATNDMVVVGCAVIGLMLGVKVCKPQSQERLNICEIEDE